MYQMMMQGGGGGGQYREESRGYLERGTSSGSGSSSAYPGASASGYGASSAGYGGSSAGYGSQPAAAAAGAGSSGYGSYAGGQAGYSQNGYGSQPAGGSYAAPAASREAQAAAGGAGGYDAWAEYAKQQQGAAAAAPVPPSYDQVRKISVRGGLASVLGSRAPHVSLSQAGGYGSTAQAGYPGYGYGDACEFFRFRRAMWASHFCCIRLFCAPFVAAVSLLSPLLTFHRFTPCSPLPCVSLASDTFRSRRHADGQRGPSADRSDARRFHPYGRT